MEEQANPNVEKPRPVARAASQAIGPAKQHRRGLIGILLADKKFAIALACITAGIGTLAASLPKVWVITPDGFAPVIRVSLLDMVQARMLSRSARKLDGEGRPTEALQAWAGALGNQPAHVGNIRSFVDFLLHRDGLEHRWLSIGAQQSQWLVSLVGTNDFGAMELAGRMCLRAGMNEAAWTYLGATNRTISTPAAKALAEAAFKTGRLKEFVSAWDVHRAEMESDPVLGLYRAAWLAVAGQPSEQAPSMATLNQGATQPDLKVIAIRLRSMVEAQRLDVAAFERSFEELRSLRGDDLEDHARAWLVLEASGNHAAAVARATAYAIPPDTAERAQQLLTTWGQLRLENLAAGFARSQLSSFPNDPSTWFLTSQMLVRAQEWEEVRSVAVRMRANPFLQRIFGGYTDFLEGVAENATGRRERAKGLFAGLLERLPEAPLLGMDAANTLERTGFRDEARAVLRRLESVYGGLSQYWFSMGRLAWQERDADALLMAAEKSYKLEPANLENINNLAAALLIARTRPEEAIKLTLELTQKASYQHSIYLNHAFALIRNGRSDEARKLLDDLPLSALTDEERTFWRLAALELELAAGNIGAAAKHIPGIDSQYLYSIQKTWLAETTKRVVDQ